MRDTTVCFLVREGLDRQVVLGLKKKGFGQGKYTGFGGKVEAGEAVETAAVREVLEEAKIQLSLDVLENFGRITFLFPANPSWDQVVHIFVVRHWEGEPEESVEMKPEWFQADRLPFEMMWQDAIHWTPLVLAGKKIEARIVLQDDNESVASVEIN